MKLTAKDIQTQVDGMRKDLEDRLTQIRAKIAEAQKVANGGGAATAARLETEMESLKATYQRTFDRKAAELKDAQDLEANQASEEGARQQAHDAVIRATALTAWQKAGGKPEEFTDQVWADIRKTHLTAATLQDLQAKQARPSSVHL
jgi:hypothetical protein